MVSSGGCKRVKENANFLLVAYGFFPGHKTRIQ